MLNTDHKLKRHETDPQKNEVLISHKLITVMPVLAHFKSSRQYRKSMVAKGVRPEIESLLGSHEYGFYSEDSPPGKRPFVRVVLWNLNNGHGYEGIVDILRNHPLISNADFYVFPGVDVGMPRTEFRNIARSLALEFGLNYVFVPSYINTSAYHPEYVDPNVARRALFLEGNAILSRRPIKNPRSLTLQNTCDPMRGPVRRIGAQKMLLVDAELAHGEFTLGCIHLDTFSSPRQRAVQARFAAKAALTAAGDRPLLLAGDFNTNTFNTRRSLAMMAGFFNKILRGADYILEEHIPYPERHFDAKLFVEMTKLGLNYEQFNEMGKGTLPFKLENTELYEPVKELLPKWAVGYFNKILQRYGGKAHFKPDWFMAGPRVRVSSHPQAEKPKVLGNLYHAGVPVSTHDAVLLDCEVF